MRHESTLLDSTWGSRITNRTWLAISHNLVKWWLYFENVIIVHGQFMLLNLCRQKCTRILFKSVLIHFYVFSSLRLTVNVCDSFMLGNEMCNVKWARVLNSSRPSVHSSIPFHLSMYVCMCVCCFSKCDAVSMQSVRENEVLSYSDILVLPYLWMYT